jgi:flavodoxin
MRALVVYESMYGNTHAVAVDIAAGLRAHAQGDLGTSDPRYPLLTPSASS